MQRHINVSLAVETSQIAKQIGAGFKGGDKIAASAGRSMGKAVTQAYAKEKGPDFDKLAADAERADKAVAASAEKGAKARDTAARQVEIAEKRVQEVRERSIRQDSAVRDAEKALNDARKSGDAGAVAKAEQALADARDKVKPTSADMAAEDKLVKARDNLATTTQKAEGELKGYKDAQEKANSALKEAKAATDGAEDSTEKAGNAFTRMGDKVKNAFKGKFKGAFKPAEVEGEKSANEVEQEFRDAGDESGKGFGSTFKAGIAGFAGGIVATVGIDKLKDAAQAVWDIGASFDEAYDTIRIGTGATGDAFESLKQSTKSIASAIPADMETVGTTVADINTRLGLTGDTLETVASQYLQAGNILGEEVDIAATTAAFSAFKLEGDSVAAGMDTLFQVSQATGVGFNELADSVQKNAPALQNLGFSFEDTAAMVGLLDKSGLNADQVMGSLSKSLVTLSKDGEKPADAFNRVTGEIQGFVDAGDIAGATNLASKVFGTRGASQFVGALQSGKLNLDELQSSLGATGDTILGLGEETADFPEKWQVFKNQALIALEPVGDAIFSLGGDAMGALTEWIKGVDFTAIATGIESVVDGAKSIWEIFANGNFDGNLFGLEEDSALVGFLFGLRDAAIGLWENALKPLGQWVADHWKDILAFFAGFGGSLIVAGLIALGGAIGGVIASISWIPLAIGAAVGALTWFFTQTETGKAILAAVVGWMVNTAWPAIQKFGQWVADSAVWLWQNALKPTWAGIQAVISAVVGWLAGTAWPLIKGVWDAIAGAAKWLWQSVIRPVWEGIKLAIAVAVTAITVYINLLKWYFDKVIAPVAMWLWNKVMKPVWSGIQAAISAVVNWFKNTAWPIFSNVINWLRTKFEQFKLGLSIIWNAIKNNVINPVVSWFKDTAWPLISGVIEKLKAGFQSMKDRLKTIWDSVKNNVIAPVANWLSDTLQPKIEGVTDNIKKAFDVMKDGVKKAWDGIKSAARVPAKFVVEDVYDKTIKETFNGVAEKLGLDTRLPNAKIGFASGGVLPGYTPGRDVHQFYSPTGGRLDLSGGEAIMRPEFTRAVGGAAGVAELNRRARRGEAFAGGGVWGKIKGVSGDAWDWLTDKASTIAEALADPLGVLTKLASKAMDLVPGGGMVRELVQKAGTNAAQQGGQWLKDRLFGSEVSAGLVPSGGAGGSLGAAETLATSMGLRVTSRGRRGARTAQSGMVSLHALGRAIDVAGSPSQMMAYFNAADARWNTTELLHSPAGRRNKHRSGRRYPNTGATLRNHYDHVHIGFADGGVFGKPFLHDRGGWHKPGELSVNQTRRPEAVLTDAQWRTMSELAERNLVAGQTIVQVQAPSTEDPGTWGRRVAESLDLHRLAATAGGI